MNGVWEAIRPGTIVDEDILMLANSGELIIEGFDPNRVRQACYELRASNIFYDIASPNEDKRVLVPSGSGYLLKPHCYVTVIVIERIRLPANVMARILTKGHLFSIGILPVNTYADPGFEGRLGITLYNGSHRYIMIHPEQPIAKVEFSVLPRPVQHPYTGQHGYETEIWPIPFQFYADVDQLKKQKLIGDEIEELKASYGEHIAGVAKRLRYYESKVWLQVLLTIAAFTVLFMLYDKIPLVVSALIGVVANLITTVGINLFGRRLQWLT